MRQVLRDLSEATSRLCQLGAATFFLAGNLFLRDPAAFQHCAGPSLLLTQSGHFGCGPGGAGCSGGGSFGSCGDAQLRCMQRSSGLRPRLLDPGSLQRKQLRLGGADGTRDVAIAAGLPSLALQSAELGFELGAKIFRSCQIGLSGAQFQLGFMSAGVQAGDVGGFLQHGPAFLGLGADQRTDSALADHRGSASAGSQVGEQGLHVAGSDLVAIDAVRRSGATLDPADDFQFRLLMKRWRRPSGRFVEENGNFGNVAGGTSAGAGEDDVLHFAAAQAAGAAFAHGPAQRLDHIGLTATVWSDDSGQSRQDLHVGGFGETLEP